MPAARSDRLYKVTSAEAREPQDPSRAALGRPPIRFALRLIPVRPNEPVEDIVLNVPADSPRFDELFSAYRYETPVYLTSTDVALPD